MEDIFDQLTAPKQDVWGDAESYYKARERNRSGDDLSTVESEVNDATRDQAITNLNRDKNLPPVIPIGPSDTVLTSPQEESSIPLFQNPYRQKEVVDQTRHNVEIHDNAIAWKQPDGTVRYQVKPLGDRFDREGLLAPLAPTEDVIKDFGLTPTEGESSLTSFGKGVGRGVVSVLNSAESPLAAPLLAAGGAEAAALKSVASGVPSFGAVSTLDSTIPALNKIAAGAFGVDMATTIPEQVEGLSQAKTPGEIAERGIGLAATGLFSVAGVKHALSAELPVTASVLAKKSETPKLRDVETTKEDLPTIGLDEPSGVPAPQEQSITPATTAPDIFDQIAAERTAPEQSAEPSPVAGTKEGSEVANYIPSPLDEVNPSDVDRMDTGMARSILEDEKKLNEPSPLAIAAIQRRMRWGYTRAKRAYENLNQPQATDATPEIERSTVSDSIAQREPSFDLERLPSPILEREGPQEISSEQLSRVGGPSVERSPDQPSESFREGALEDVDQSPVISNEQPAILGEQPANPPVEAQTQETPAEAPTVAPQEAEVAPLVNENPVTGLLENEVNQGTLQKIGGRLNIPEQERGDFANDVAARILQSEERGTGFKAPENSSPEGVQKAFRGYVNRVAENLARDRATAANAAKRSAPEVSLDEELVGGGPREEIVGRPDVTPDESIQSAASDLLDTLTPTEQEVLRSVVQNGESQSSVGGRLKVSRQRIQQIQKSALKKMRQKMSERGFSREDLNLDDEAEFPNYGPGAANLLEFLSNPQKTTSTMNRVMNAERAERGETPVLREAVQTNQETFDMAESAVDANPGLGRELVTNLLNGTKTAVSEVDEAVLLYEKVRLRNERNTEADRAADPYESEEYREAARQRWEDLEHQIDDIDRATRKSGTIWGRLGQYRQRLLREDYTFEAMERKARVSKGRPLTPEESDKIKTQADRISQDEKVVEESQTKAEEKSANDELDAWLKNARVNNPEFSISKRVLEIAQNIVTKLDTAADAARARIRNRLANASAGVDPTVIYDLAVIGASKLARATLDAARFGVAMKEDIGDWVEPYLDEVFEKSKGLLDEQEKGVPVKDRATIKKARTKIATDTDQISAIRTAIDARIKEGGSLGNIRSFVNKLALKLVQTGTRGREQLVDKVHAVLQGIIPDITRSQSRDLISGYGDFRPLSKDESKTQLRAYKGELQQIAKIESLEGGKGPQKTGMERRTPSAEERRLGKIVNELKRRGGFVVTDPETQLRTARDAIKTRLRNEIEDLDKAIIDKLPLVKKESTVTDDPEITALRAQREAKRAEYDELFPKDPLTDEQIIQRTSASLDRSIAEVERQLKDDQLYPELPRKLTSPEIEAKRARLDALRAERQTLRDLDTAVVEQKKEQALFAAIDRAQTDIPDQPRGIDTVDTEQVANLKEQLVQVRQQRRDERNQDAEYRESQREAQLLRAIESAQKESRKSKDSPYTADTQRVAELKARLAEIREARATSPEALQKKIDTAKESVQKSIDDLDRRIKEGDFSKTRTAEPVRTDELDALRNERDAMRSLYRELEAATKPKKTREEIALQAYKTRTANKIAELQERLANKDFEVKKRTPIQLDEEGKKASYDLFKVKKQFEQERYKDLQAKRHPAIKTLSGVRDVLNASRSLITSFDLSGVLNQGGLLVLGNPVMASRSIPKMLKAAFSEKYQHEINNEINSRPNAELYAQSKLALVDPNSPVLAKKEEAYMTSLFERLEPSERKSVLSSAGDAAKTAFNLATAPVRASERAYVTFLNLLRADAFDAMTKGLRDVDGKLDVDDAKAVANFVNVATGRGNIASGTAGVNLNAAFFSPRLLVSRFEYLLGLPVFRKSSGAAKAMIAKEYAKFFTAAAVVYSLSQLAGAQIELDPRSSDFMKIRIGNTRLDPLGGLAQATVFLTRFFGGSKKSVNGKISSLQRPSAAEKLPFGSDDAWDVTGNFIRSKLNPALGTLINLRAGQDPTGSYFGPKEAAKSLFIPLSFGDIQQAIQEQGVAKGTALALLNLFGLRMQNYSTNQGATQQDAQIAR